MPERTERIGWCRRCRDIFALPPACGDPGGGLKCTLCGGADCALLQARRPAEGLDAVGPAPWEFVCHRCGIYLEVASPRSPEEAAAVACPACGGRDMERLHVCSLENMSQTCFG